MTFRCCHFDVAVLILGFRDVLPWLKRQIAKQTDFVRLRRVANRHPTTLLDGVWTLT